MIRSAAELLSSEMEPNNSSLLSDTFEKGATLWVSNARGWASWARGLLTKDAAAAIAELRAVINAKREREERQTLYAWYGLLAELQSAAGAVDDAVAIKQGLELAERTGGHRMDARLHRLRGDKQIFDTWAGVLPAGEFRKWCIEPCARIVAAVRKQIPGARIIGFPRGAGTELPRYSGQT
jgi:hypothetical protein